MSPERAVQEVMGRYARAVDSRNADDLVALFAEDGRERISNRRDGVLEQIAQFETREGVREALRTLLKPHAPGAWAHHATFDHLIAIKGERATLDAQFILWAIEPGNPPAPELSGYYEWILVKIDDEWLIVDSHIILTVPVDAN